MTLSDFATFSTAISGIAVPISLIYLAIQTGQNSKHTRALIQQGLTARTIEIALANQRPETCVAWIEGNGGEATREEIVKLQFGLFCATAYAALEDLYRQRADGLLNVEHFERNCGVFRGLLSQPGFRNHWNSIRDEVGRGAPRYCRFVDSLIVGEATAYSGVVS